MQTILCKMSAEILHDIFCGRITAKHFLRNILQRIYHEKFAKILCRNVCAKYFVHYFAQTFKNICCRIRHNCAQYSCRILHYCAQNATQNYAEWCRKVGVEYFMQNLHAELCRLVCVQYFMQNNMQTSAENFGQKIFCSESLIFCRIIYARLIFCRILYEFFTWECTSK